MTKCNAEIHRFNLKFTLNKTGIYIDRTCTCTVVHIYRPQNHIKYKTHKRHRKRTFLNKKREHISISVISSFSISSNYLCDDINPTTNKQFAQHL